MFGVFIPRTWRLPQVVWFLMVFELPFTVANLALFGIASPNLYRTILWREGGKLGFNSDPSTVVYAYANYRPVNIPLVWSNFNTQFHLIIGVTCMFFYLVKSTLWLLHVFVPLLSLLLHLALVSLWAYGLHIQTSPDTIDPHRINNGPPWFITKSCGVVEDKQIRSYCMQAKASFAVSIIMLSIYALFVLVSIYSLIPTAAQKTAHANKRASKRALKEKYNSSSPYDNEMTAEEQWQHMWELQQLPRSPGPLKTPMTPMTPMTPRTRAFNDLDGENTGETWAQRVNGGGAGSINANGMKGGGWYAGQNRIKLQPVSPVEEEHRGHFGGGSAH